MTTAEKYARHVDPTFVKLLGVLGYGRVYTKAEGAYVWDEQGRRYLDLLAGFGSVNIGHNHPRLLAHMRELLDEHAVNLHHIGPSPYAAQLAEELSRLAGLDISLFSNSGAEAVEAAIKLARAATGRKRIVFCEGAYHGLTLGTLSVSSSKRMRAMFEPLIPDCTPIPFGDLGALARELKQRDVAAFLVEPIQVEGGLRFPPENYLRDARDLCTSAGTLFAVDEVQTGLGRTGAMFAFERPDILILAKALGGGIAPIGVTMTTRRVQQQAYGSMRKVDLHGSTFAGNTFACVAALETLHIIEDEKLVERSRENGAAFLSALRERLHGHPRVRDIRGRGLLIAIEITRFLGQWFALALLERGVIVQPASQAWNVLRIEPPLTIDQAQIAEAVDAIAAVFDENRGLTSVLRQTTKRMATQLVSGGRFR